ncbi:5127_t:CDS:2, partial [Racocetra fulgida]
AIDNLHSAEINQRVKIMLEIGDPEIIIDMRINNGFKGTKFDEFGMKWHHFASKYKKYTCLIFADDKYKIPIGELVPTSTGVRNKKMATSTKIELSAADHDFTKLSITPSVSLFVKIPDDPIQSFYARQVYVSLKNTIFQASSALRHATEFYDSIEQYYFNANSLPEIVIVYTDG